jgi:hypothetical protein
MDVWVESEKPISEIPTEIVHPPETECSDFESDMKDIPMSPTTNCSHAPSLDELSTDAVLEEFCSEAETYCELSVLQDPMPATAQDLSGPQLNSLIQTLLEIDFKEHEAITAEAVERVTGPTCTSGSSFGVSSVALSQTVACEQDVDSAVPHHPELKAETLAAKKGNVKKKKCSKKPLMQSGTSGACAKETVPPRAASKKELELAARQQMPYGQQYDMAYVQRYNMARYQMAYAQQYNTAMQAARMQHAAYFQMQQLAQR